MIELTPKIQNDLSSSVNNFDLLFVITASGNTYHLSTQSQTLDGIYYDDLIMKVGGLKESINLKDKKIKLSGTSISINNAEMSGIRFSDTIVGEMSGGIVNIYIKTQSCESLDDCNTIASLKITGVTHDSSKIDLKCEDRYIDELHKELPLSEHTLYQDRETFVGDNEKRIPVLYGHLKKAPAVVYIDKYDDENEIPFADNNIFIVPDRAFKDTYDIVGVKEISPFAETSPSNPNEIINQDVLSIKLGDHAANVYSQSPDRLNQYLLEGTEDDDYKNNAEWYSQFSVEGNYVNLLTRSDNHYSKTISSGNLLCGEISKLVGVNTYKQKWFRRSGGISGDHLSDTNNDLDSTPISLEHIDMFSIPSVFIDDTSGYNSSQTDNMIRLGYNTEGTYLTGGILEAGHYHNFEAPIFEFEFEPLKSSISVTKGKERDVITDASIIGHCNFISKCIDLGISEDQIFKNYQLLIYPEQATYFHPDSVSTYTILIGDDLDDTGSEVQLGSGETPLGVVRSIWYTDDDDSEGNPRGNQWENVSGIVEEGMAFFTDMFTQNSPFRVYLNRPTTEGSWNDDFRHTFHTTKQDTISNWTNTWRQNYRFLDDTNWESQNIFTGYFIPRVYEGFELGGALIQGDRPDYAIKSSFSGLQLKRSWYQESIFDESFFVNAKGKYVDMPNQDANDGYPKIFTGKNLQIIFSSSSEDVGNNPDQIDNETKHDEEQVLTQLLDYLLKDSLKSHYANGYEYELVVSCDVEVGGSVVDNIVLFDFDVTNFEVEHISNKPDYKFMINSKIYRNGDGANTEFWDIDDDYYGTSVRLRYARKIIVGQGYLDSWVFLDEDEGEISGFIVADYDPDFKGINNISSIDFENDDTNNKLVKILFNSTTELEDSAYQLIRNPSDVTNDIISREFNINNSINRKNIDDRKYLLDFSLYEKEEGIDVMQKISQSSPFFYKTTLSSGVPSIVGIMHTYSDDNIDKSINENQIIKYKFTKSKIEDVALKCRVKYGFDYVKEEYIKVTPDVEHTANIKQDYIDMYDIKDEETYTLEYEAPYIQEKVSAEILAKHLFEIFKNQHLLLSFQIPLGDGIELEVGDTINFIDNNGNKTNILNTKPYGMDMTTNNLLIDQVVFPYFMITSIKKDLTKVDIECVQLHELAPSEYDDWVSTEVGEEEEEVDVPTGDVTGDDNVDIFDIIQVINHILGDDELDQNQIFQADLNQDGIVTVQDVVLMLNIILGTEVEEILPVASFKIHYDDTLIEFFDGDTIPITDYIFVNGWETLPLNNITISEAQSSWIWTYSRIRNGIPISDSVLNGAWGAGWIGGEWIGECSVTLVVTDSEGIESEPVTISWTGE